MPRYVLDTNIISELIKPAPDPLLVNWLSPIPKRDLFLSAITIGEIAKGIASLPREHPRRNILENWLEKDVLLEFAGRILPFEAETAYFWGKLMWACQTTGLPCSPIDLQIAATAERYTATLVTRNTKDFPTSTTINPWKL
jgi:toxin FitB